MASLVFTAAVTAPSSGFRLPSRRPSPSALAPAHVILRRRGLPTRGLRRAGADEECPEPCFVAVAEKLDSARKARGAAGTDDGEEEMGRAGVINGVNDGAVEEPVVVPFAPFEQSLVAVDRFGDDALSQAVGSKVTFVLHGRCSVYCIGVGLRGDIYLCHIRHWCFLYWMDFVCYCFSNRLYSLDQLSPKLFPWSLPKLLEIIGLGYTLWFSARYLLFKENRDELLVKAKDLKKRIVGSNDE
ncbi:hypothetical protein PR202_ga17739 [Eleusine coracana subsp. coracana]|uniref:Cyanobacterial aminoacyl-tRNA synthetase CAAD domain-containing protein n=1 Tax=Eleusine coracana subsp. coracana TaxID=191504 RepID=A0AAV5CR74_ELECO|nr:hypothetical protein PR202_ga17492 [Eleusine coracana subsp. coracana]GJN00548.1 hypothetical protein PR202_ga17739 [Eleusine coracana subsp. coracana]